MDDEEKLYKSYELVVNARNFHYQEFNKWMTFFYVAIGAIFVSFYTLNSKTLPVTEDTLLLKKMAAFVGFIISILGYLSSKGYYYWMLNWQNQVTRFEKMISKGNDNLKIYSVFSEKVYNKMDNVIDFRKPANISTSKITIFFFLFISLVWGVLLFYQFFGFNWRSNGLSIAATFISYKIGGIFLKSMVDVKNTHTFTKP